MSLTDAEKDELLISFFQEEFKRAAELLSKEGVKLLVTEPDPNCETYYIQRQKTTIEQADFEIDLDNMEQLKQALEQLCKTPEERLILVDLFEKILNLAPLYESVEQTEEVSPFIYVMF